MLLISYDTGFTKRIVSYMFRSQFCRSPVQFSLDWGDKVIGLNHPPTTTTHHPPQTLNYLNTKEFRVNQKTKVDGLYEDTPKQFFDPTSTPK